MSDTGPTTRPRVFSSVEELMTQPAEEAPL
jgi:hypothetical protein